MQEILQNANVCDFEACHLFAVCAAPDMVRDGPQTAQGASKRPWPVRIPGVAPFVSPDASSRDLGD